MVLELYNADAPKRSCQNFWGNDIRLMRPNVEYNGIQKAEIAKCSAYLHKIKILCSEEFIVTGIVVTQIET